MDAFDHQDAVVDLDLAGGLPDKTAVACIDVTRLQRAPEGSRQSAAGSCDDVIKGGRALGISGSGDAVVLGDLVVNAEVDRLALTRYLRAAQRSANAFDPYPRDVLNLTHDRDVTCRVSTRRRQSCASPRGSSLPLAYWKRIAGDEQPREQENCFSATCLPASRRRPRLP